MTAESPPSDRHTIPPARYRERLERAASAAADGGFDALLVGTGPDLRYLTGYEALPLERLTLLVLPADGEPVLVVPRLERPAAEAGLRVELPIVAWDETDDPYAIVAGRVGGGLGRAPRLAVSDRLWALHLLRLEAVLPAAEFSPASVVLRRLRMRKDPDELRLLAAAAAAADRVVEAIAWGRLVGRTEAEVAREVRERLVAEGHETAEFAIVASGPNAASPHHEASGRRIGPGEPIVLDIGGTLGGYGSDITRTIWVTGGDPGQGPDETFRTIHRVVQEAQAAAVAAVRPGIPAEALDAVARSIIEAAGYGDAFIHRTGHGIGLEGHEDPYLVAGNPEPIEPGMAFSIEPGIYLEGRYGVRIEDIVVCGESGPTVLNGVSRELLVVPG
ncbi:MAG TPA: Xaa-Pro peptidase family protein [Candidatus Binatia bacterium]|nr:Xaa-Pro peptidase family protein [Candidatus Binatia bacterium]